MQQRKGKEWQSLTLLTNYVTKWSFYPMFNTVLLRNLNWNFLSRPVQTCVCTKLMYHAIPASPMPPGLCNPRLEFWHQSGSTGGPIPVSRTSSLNFESSSLAAHASFPDPWSRGTKTLPTRVHVSNSEGTLQLKAKKTLSWKDYRSLPTLKFWEVMGVLVHKYQPPASY